MDLEITRDKMTDFDNAPYSSNGSGAEGGGPEIRAMPFFPAPPNPSPMPAPGAPLGAAAQHGLATRPVEATSAGKRAAAPAEHVEEEIPGRIRIEDDVVEKIVVLAAREVAGVAGLAAGGIRVRTSDTDLSLDLTLVVEYGSVMMEVARNTRDNVGRVAGRMLGLRVSAVNVTVGDVWMPEAPPAT